MRSGHANARTYGTKLRGRISDEVKPNFPVTTRICDIEHYNRTGELKYLDEESEIMTVQDGRENAKRMRAEITTLEQYNNVGNYSDVAKKYHVTLKTAHEYKKKLARLEKNGTGENTPGEPMEQTVNETSSELQHEESANETLSDASHDNGTVLTEDDSNGNSELREQDIEDCDLDGNANDCKQPEENENTGCQSDITCSDCPEILSVTFCRECGDILVHSKDLEICKDCADGEQGQGLLLSGEAIDRLEDDIQKIDPIEAMWNVVESDLEVIRKLYVEKANREFDARCKKTLMRITAC